MDTRRDDATVARVAAADKEAADRAKAAEDTRRQAEAARVAEAERRETRTQDAVQATEERTKAEVTEAKASDAVLPISKMPLAEQGAARWAALKTKIEGEMAALSASFGLVNDLIHDANRDGDALAARERADRRERDAARVAEIAHDKR